MMMHLKNIVAGNAKTSDQFQLTKRFGVIWLYSEDGKNWYEEQKNFSADTIKIAYDKNNVIVDINKDVSTINPEGLSVVEVSDITANRRADASGNWMFLDGSVIKRIYTPDELRQQAEAKKTRLLAEATPRISWLEDAQNDGDISADEEKELATLRAYRTELRRLDLTGAPDINWPEVPGDVA